MTAQKRGFSIRLPKLEAHSRGSIRLPKIETHVRGSYRVRIKGKEFYLGTKPEQVLEAYGKALIAAYGSAGQEELPDAIQSLEHGLQAIWESYRHRSSKEALKRFLRMLQRSKLFHCPWSEIDPEAIQRFFFQLRERYSPSTMAGYQGAFNKALRYAYSEGTISFEDLERCTYRKRIDNPNALKPSTRSPANIVSLCRFLREHEVQRNVDLTRVLLKTGARPSEILGIDKREIQKINGTNLYVYKPKLHKNSHRGMERAIYLTSSVMRILNRYPDPFPFRMAQNTLHQAMRNFCLRNDLERITPYQMRHTAITRFRNRHGVEAASWFAGHSKTRTTEIYSKRSRDTLIGILS